MTDCARISIVLSTPDGLYAAAKFLLERASTFKNRVANRTDEGYADLMFTLPMSNGHICEVRPPPDAPLAPPPAHTAAHL